MVNQTINLTEKREDILKKRFSGTEHYYKASSLYNLNLTDGLEYLRNSLNCFWLIDIVGSVQHLKKIKENSSFILWSIIVNKDRSFIVRAYSDYSSEENEEYNKKYLLYEQKGEYTDFLLEDYEFYQINDVLLLKGEY